MPERLQTIQHKTDAYHTLTQGNYIHHYNQVANAVFQEEAFKCGLSKGPQMLHYKYESQSVLENSSYKLYYDRYIITDHTVHSNRLHIVKLEKPNKEPYIADVATPKSHNLYSMIIKKFQKHTDLKQELTKQENWTQPM